MSTRDELAAVLKRHLPKDRYDEDGFSVGTYCIGCEWTGDYFAEGEAGPFDDHVAEALLPVLADVWDEGYTIGNRHNGRRDANPYRTTRQLDATEQREMR